MQSFHASQKQSGPLLNFLEQGPPPNQTDVVGLLKFELQLMNPTASILHARIAAATLKYFARHDVFKSMPVEFGVGRSHLENGMCHLFFLHRKEKLPLSVFWSTHKLACSALFSAEEHGVRNVHLLGLRARQF